MSSDSGDELWGYDHEDDPSDARRDPLRPGYGQGFSVRSGADVDHRDDLEDDGELRLHHPDHGYGEDDDDFDEYEWDGELDPLGSEDEPWDQPWDQPWLVGQDHELGWPFDEVDTRRVTRHLRIEDTWRVRGWLVRLDQEEDFSEVEPTRLVRYWNILKGFKIHIGQSEYESAVRAFLGDLAHAIDRCCDSPESPTPYPSMRFRDQLLRNGHAPSGVWTARLLVDRVRATISLRFGYDWSDKEVADRAFDASLREIRDEADDLARRSTSSPAHRLLLAASAGCSGWLFEGERVLSMQGLYRSLVEQSAEEESAPVEGPELEVLSEAVLHAFDDEDPDRILEAAQYFASVAPVADLQVVHLNVAERLDRMDSTMARLIADRLLADAVASRGASSEAAFHAAHIAHTCAARDGDRGRVADLEAMWIPRALDAPHGWASQQWVELAADRP